MSYSHYPHKKKNNEQLSLFETKFIYDVKKPNLTPDFAMSKDFLETWKNNLYQYQQNQRKNLSLQTNFLETNTMADVDIFDPFSLETHPDRFYDLPNYNLSESCLYFILDTHTNLLLYIGETKLSPSQRWINHDCKSYIQSYIELHRKYKLNVLIRSAFFWGMPTDRKLRQTIEKNLIVKWRSPFNKESWQYWGQPFK
ncbi:GIY-YIG nuclease family protein [Geminocystis sp. CENA526]|uniref:GIY-YIG nuclease family protein n=1 Tax=Geminocystis sp. CENA526 TaxID=1355871 RepID=UPI003D6EA238